MTKSFMRKKSDLLTKKISPLFIIFFNKQDVTQIIMGLPVLWNATITVKIVLVMTLMVSVLWDVRRGSMETSVTDNVQVVRQVVIH